MSTTVDYRITREQRDLVTSLHQADEATRGRPRVPAESLELARDYLSLLLTEVRAEVVHFHLLEELSRAQFRCPLSRFFWQGEPRPPLEVAAGFRHNQFLSEETARAVAEHGPTVLSPDDLAALLLNPYALWDLDDLIHYLCPEYWQGRIDQSGLDLIERHGLQIPIPGYPEASEDAQPR